LEFTRNRSFMPDSGASTKSGFVGITAASNRIGEHMTKFIAALGLSSALLVAPALAQNAPAPDANAPAAAADASAPAPAMHHRHHHRHHHHHHHHHAAPAPDAADPNAPK
jgi:hypothetical protein